MAEIIYAHIERVPTIAEVEIDFTRAINNTFGEKGFTDEVYLSLNTSNKLVDKNIFFGAPVYIRELNITLSNNFYEMKAKLIPADGNDTTKLVENMKKYGEVSVHIQQNFIEYTVSEYIKYEVDKLYRTMGKGKKRARLTDTVIGDKRGKFKVTTFEIVTLWCDLCDDEHEFERNNADQYFDNLKLATYFIKMQSNDRKLRLVKQ